MKSAKEFFADKKNILFIKFTNKKEWHNHFKYRTGKNTDNIPFNPSGKCQPGGLYFCDVENAHLWICKNYYCRIIDVESMMNDENCYIYIEPCGTKYKTNILYLFPPKLIETESCLASNIEAIILRPKLLVHIHLSDNNQIYNDLIEKNACMIQFIPPEHLTNDMCVIAVKKYPWLIKHIPKNLITPEICKYSAAYTNLLLFVPHHLHTPELYEYIFSQNGLAIKYAHRDILTVELCKIAINNDGTAIGYIPSEYQFYYLYLLAVQQNGLAIAYISREKRNKELCIEAIKNNKLAIKHIPNYYQ